MIDGKILEKICKINMEYTLLGSLISSDNILTIKDAKNRLKRLREIEKALKTADITKEKQNEIKEYITKGKEILNKDIENIREQRNKKKKINKKMKLESQS